MGVGNGVIKTHRQLSESLAHTKVMWLAFQGQSLVSGATFEELVNVPILNHS